MRGLILNKNKYLKERGSGKRYGFIIGLVAIFLIIIIGSTFSPREYSRSVENNTTSDDAIAIVEEKKSEPTKPQIIRNDIPEKHLVTEIVDGDTIYVSDIKKRIRLIGINTPEIYNEPVQCYGPEASNYLKEFILGKYVGLESDAASGDVDIYGRPLRYVYYNGENVNQKILLEGYGKEVSYGSEYKYRSQFISAENYASARGIGLWSTLTCSGQE